MFIFDLEHLQTLAEAPNILGAGISNVVSLSLNNDVLSLKLDDKELWNSSIANAPSSFMISLEDNPNLKGFYRFTNSNGVTAASWFLSSGSISSHDFSPFISRWLGLGVPRA